MNAKDRLKQIILGLARAFGLFTLARWSTRNSILVIGWHGVSQDNEHERFKSLFISPQTFRRRLEFLSKHYEIISLDEALSQHGNKKFKPGQAILTFDDAFYNFKSVAMPILEEFGMTATVYIVSGKMSGGDPFFPLLVRDMLLSSREKTANISIPELDELISLKNGNSREEFQANVLDYVNGLSSSEEKMKFCRTLAIKLKVVIDPILERRTWDSLRPLEVQSLKEQGFSMELHSHTHLRINKNPAQLEDEMLQCKNIVEEASGTKAVHFCYPAGFWDRPSWKSLQKMGIRTATTTREGPNFVKTPLLSMRRFLDGEDRTQLDFECGCSNLRWLFHILSHPKRFYEPSEKTKRYSLDSSLY